MLHFWFLTSALATWKEREKTSKKILYFSVSVSLSLVLPLEFYGLLKKLFWCIFKLVEELQYLCKEVAYTPHSDDTFISIFCHVLYPSFSLSSLHLLFAKHQTDAVHCPGFTDHCTNNLFLQFLSSIFSRMVKVIVAFSNYNFLPVCSQQSPFSHMS